jgi:hypothetical protein
MKSEICEFEEFVAGALASGLWSGELRQHLSGCTHCAELELVWQFLAPVATDEETVPLPAPGLIWWRSQIAGRRAQAECAVAAIALMQELAIAVALTAVVVFAWLWTPGVWTISIGLSMALVTGAVLYGWARGRI